MATRKTKTAAPALPVPQSREQCQTQITSLGQMLRRHAVMKAELDEKVAELTQQYGPLLADLQAEADRLHQGIQIWATSNRDALTQGGKTKTVNLVTGEVSWRQRPPSCAVRKAADVLAELRKLGLQDYIRTTQEVNKDAILALDSAVEKITVEDLAGDSPEAGLLALKKLHLEFIRGIPGISLVKGVEDFTATPFETEAATTAI